MAVAARKEGTPRKLYVRTRPARPRSAHAHATLRTPHATQRSLATPRSSFSLQAAFAAFEAQLKAQGHTLESFAQLPEHEQVKMLNKYLTAGQPAREIGSTDWRQAVEALLEVEPAEQTDDCFSLDDPNWTVIEIPATLTGMDGEAFKAEMPLPHVHGEDHGIATESVTMGVQVIRSVPGAPKSFVINFFQSWSTFVIVFASIELERVEADGEEEADEQFKFVRGVFHPGAFGLIDEDEMEFLGFVESFALDAAGVENSEDGNLLPGKWTKRGDKSRLYRPGGKGSDGRATLQDCESKTVFAADHVVKRGPGDAPSVVLASSQDAKA